MAYSGFLVKIGTFTIPNNRIKAETYTAYRSVQDLDSYRDANGVLHRNALEHIPCKCEFEIKPMLTNTEWDSLMSSIRSQYTNELERKGIVTMYIPELGDYVTQEAYMAEPQPEIYGTYGGVIRYHSCRISFIGY